LGLVALAAFVLGVTAQLLRQVQEPFMALGAATAPWLTIGFLVAIWVTRQSAPIRRASGLGVATMAIYLFVWLLTYHVTFALRESVGLGAGWREAAPWLLVAVPASVVLGIAAAVANRGGLLGDICVAFPIAWSIPEIVANWKLDWLYAMVVVLPTAVLAVSPPLVVRRRDVKVVRVAVAAILLAIICLSALPVMRSYIRS
jgi:hypothetical protein